MDEGMSVAVGPSPAEVGNEIGEHRQRAHDAEPTGRDRAVTIIEATLLALRKEWLAK